MLEASSLSDRVFKLNIIQHGNGAATCPQNATAYVHFSCSLETGKVIHDTRRLNKPERYELSSDQLSLELKLCILSMRVGEISCFKIKQVQHAARQKRKLHLQSFQRAQEALSCDAYIYEIELISHDLQPCYSTQNLTTEAERTQKASNKKEDGNLYFSQKEYKLAMKEYYIAYHLISCDRSELLETLLLNISACCIPLSLYDQGIHYCTRTLELDPNNIKAYYRRSTCYMKKQQYEEAQMDIVQALSIAPTNQALIKQQATIKTLQTKQDQQERRMYNKLFH
ncbi:peptidyl-prolyl cis-trans isomerase [Acrasis kona]|uniref:Peptidyl-prolyl cis-trans isomerase n=1 Tax=Acrasis kona TaxID=1008807 RepID=A0AAW2ZBP9_9EUKA